MYMPEGGPRETDAKLQVQLRGRVQGVFFRAFVHGHAQRLGLVGLVRNLPGGRELEVVAEGSRSALEELLVHIRQGPPRAQVSRVAVEWDTSRGEFTKFEAL